MTNGQTGLKKPLLWFYGVIKSGHLLQKIDVKFNTNLIPVHI